MTELPTELVGRPLILDTNLLLLLIVGSESPDLIPKCKRLTDFTPDDFELLAGIVGQFGCLVTTPNIATETNNLARQTKGAAADAWATRFRLDLAGFPEVVISTRDAVQDPSFDRVGLTDVATALTALRMADRRPMVLTTDFDLCTVLEARGVDAQNFNHVRHWI